LHHCAEYGWLEEARLLLERGADPNAPAESMEGDFDTRTPIYNTLTTNANVSWDVLNLLLASGADVNIRANVRVGEEALRDVTPHSRGAWG
jgi:ankyrin repeat protein